MRLGSEALWGSPSGRRLARPRVVCARAAPSQVRVSRRAASTAAPPTRPPQAHTRPPNPPTPPPRDTPHTHTHPLYSPAHPTPRQPPPPTPLSAHTRAPAMTGICMKPRPPLLRGVLIHARWLSSVSVLNAISLGHKSGGGVGVGGWRGGGEVGAVVLRAAPTAGQQSRPEGRAHLRGPRPTGAAARGARWRAAERPRHAGLRRAARGAPRPTCPSASPGS